MGGVVLLIAGFVGTELFARFYLGLGDPPLSIADPRIEYLFKPGDYQRFGNHVHYNAYSMRSQAFPRRKRRPRELRILVMGDSVINGGNLTDQSDLATTLLKHRLHQQLNRPVVVGNISAGSWGPGNLLAYAKRYGFFDADVVFIEMSSHDAGDNPTYKPVVGVNPNYPAHKPLLAIQEGVMRYLPRYLPDWGADKKPGKLDQSLSPEAIQKGTEDLAALFHLAKASGARVILVQHWDRREAETGHPKPGHDAIERTAKAAGVKVIQLGPRFQAALAQGEHPYRDRIHPDPLGQRLMAQTLDKALMSTPAASVAAAPASSR